MRLVDTNGRTVERTLTRPVLATVNRIGIKPSFDRWLEASPQGSQRRLQRRHRRPDRRAHRRDRAQVDAVADRHHLSVVSRQRHLEVGGRHHHAPDRRRHASTPPPPARRASRRPVDWGRYRLEVTSTGDNPTSSSYEFYAGYYYASAGSDTPDKLQVALDKPAYTSGDTAHLKLDPQFAGTALVMVVDDRIITMKAVDVPAGGTTVDLPVTDDWGPGAYVTATLYRPASAAEKRMPARALGLAFADVDPGDRDLKVNLDLPKDALPRQAFSVKVSLPNAKAGDKAYVAVAAVDLGILNLTNFKVPDPGWLVLRPAPARRRVPRPLRPVDRSDAGHSRRRPLGRRRGRVAARHAAADLGARRAPFGRRRSRRRRHRDRQLRHARFLGHGSRSWRWPGRQTPSAMARPTSSSAIRW